MSSYLNYGPLFHRLKLLFIRISLMLGLGFFISLVKVLAKYKTESKNFRKETDGLVILLTGRFYSDNWIMSHLLPLSMASTLKHVIIVSTYKIPEIDNIEVIYPSPLLIRLVGSTPARLLTFIKVGLKRKPHVIGGFHLLLNGLVSLLLARCVGAVSLYNCGGGIREVAGGGYSTENRLFKTLGQPNHKIESQLLQAVSFFDLVIVRGKKTARYFADYVSPERIHVVTGGIDGRRFFPATGEKKVDLVITGRISEVKRIDRFIRSVELTKNRKPDISAIIIGDGPLRSKLEKMVDDLGLSKNITFVGHQSKVEEFLRQAKLFVLTSDSEGLSLALIEAMLCGLPAIVSDVGDLSDLVEHGVSGYLIPNREPVQFAYHYLELLNNVELLNKMSLNGTALAAQKCELKNISKLWDDIFGNLWWAEVDVNSCQT